MKIKNKSLSEKSRKWLRRHLDDPYVKLSKDNQYRSRAAFKLIEIDEKYNILRSSRSVVDLGGAPGSWTEVILEKIKKPKKIITVDLLEIQPLPGAEIIQDDFTSESFYEIMNNNFTSFLSPIYHSYSNTTYFSFRVKILLLKKRKLSYEKYTLIPP